MKKKILTMLSALFLFVSMALPVSAAETAARLADLAELLTDSEEAALCGVLDEISIRQGMDVVIVTVPDTYPKTAEQYADDYYDEHDYAPDGILLLISMYEREWCISTAGAGMGAFTDAGLDYIAGQFTDALSEGEYFEAFSVFAELSDEFMTQAETGRAYDGGSLPKVPFNLGERLLTALVIGLAAALIITTVMRFQLKRVRGQSGASYYVKDGSMQVTQSNDLFLYTHTSRIRKEKPKSGGSSTHVSSSGRSHGGRSGRF